MGPVPRLRFWLFTMMRVALIVVVTLAVAGYCQAESTPSPVNTCSAADNTMHSVCKALSKSGCGGVCQYCPGTASLKEGCYSSKVSGCRTSDDIDYTFEG